MGIHPEISYSRYSLEKYLQSLTFLEHRQQNVMNILRFEEIFIQTVVLLEYVVTHLPEIQQHLGQLKAFLD